MGQHSFGNQRASVRAYMRREVDGGGLTMGRRSLPQGIKNVLQELAERDNRFVEGMLNAIDDSLFAHDLRARR